MIRRPGIEILILNFSKSLPHIFLITPAGRKDAPICWV